MVSQLPAGWRYGIEIRNASFLQPEYFTTLARHGVSHVFNSWEAMPPLPDQLALPDAFASKEHAVARLLLRPGRDYEEAVKRFQPYDRLQDPYPEGREAIAQLLGRVAKRDSGVPKVVYVYVNNRFEGNALQTIAALVDTLVPRHRPGPTALAES